ncbi:hypothetical protein D1007_47562 [Hordeum vulgare]|nr:hypothetical protein D1007_47562 [Hordeum vulgare]
MLEEYEKLAAAVPDGSAKLRVFLFPASGADQPASGSGSHLTAVDETGQRYIDAIKCVSANAVAAIRRRESVATAARPRTTPRPPSPPASRKGDHVDEFQQLCEVQSDKATIEITSRFRGTVHQIQFAPRDIVKVGEQIQEFSVIGKYDDPLDPAGCFLDLAAIHAREEAALREFPLKDALRLNPSGNTKATLTYLRKLTRPLPTLADEELTYLRKLARPLPTHFALEAQEKWFFQIPRSSAISLLQKIRQLGGIAIMHTLVACLHQTEPEQRVLAANLLLQLDMLSSKIEVPIGPLPWAPLSRCSSDPSADKMELAKGTAAGTLHGRGGPPTTMNMCELTPEPDELDNDNIVNLDLDDKVDP